MSCCRSNALFAQSLITKFRHGMSHLQQEPLHFCMVTMPEAHTSPLQKGKFYKITLKIKRDANGKAV
jgi:hypothetical protein